MKYNENDNLPYRGEYLSENAGKCGVTGIVPKGKNTPRT